MFSLRTFLFIFVARGRNTAAVDPNALNFLKICIADEIAFDAVRIFSGAEIHGKHFHLIRFADTHKISVKAID